MEKDSGISIGIGVAAAVNVAVANTVHTLTHPLRTARVIFGLEKAKSIPEMIREEEARMIARRKQAHQSGD